MKKFLLLLIFFLLVAFIQTGCDSNNNVIAQDDDLPGAMAPGMTIVKGSVIPINGQCGSQLDGFDMGDEVTVTLIEGNSGNLPNGTVENTTKGTSVDCSMTSGSGVIVDDLPYSGLVCEPANNSIPGFSNSDFISMVISFTWIDSFVDNIPKTLIVVSGNLGGASDTKNVPCARVQIESLSAMN